jgi:phage-related protein
MGIVLEDADTNQENLDDSFVIRNLQLESPDSMQKAALQHGGRDISQRTFNHRNVSVAGVVYSDTRQGFDTDMNALLTFIAPGSIKLYPDSTLDKYLMLTKMTSYKQTFVSGLEFRTAQVQLEFVCEDPFWQDVTLTTESSTLTSGDYLALDNDGTVDCYPIITLENTGSNAALITLVNESDSDNRFLYNDLAFTANTTIVVNGVAGTVQRGGVNTIRYKTGSFIKLVTGANTIAYAGPDASYSLQYRQRYL